MWRTVPFLLILALAGCSFTEDTAAPPNELTDLERGARVSTIWSADTGWGATDKWEGLAPQRIDKTLFAANVDGEVSAYALDNGDRRWRIDLDERLSAGVGAADDTVYVGTSEGTVVALAADDGEERWRKDVGGEVLAAPAASEDDVVVRTVDGRVIALDAGDGSRMWTYTGDVPSLSLRGSGAPLRVAGGVIVGLDDGQLVALAQQNGRPLWQTTVAEPSGSTAVQRMVDIDGTVGLGRNVAYAVTYQGKIAQIEPRKGRVQWSREMSSFAGVNADRDRVYVSNADSHVIALDPETGATLWRQEKLAHRRLTAPVPVPGTPFLAVADLEGYVHFLTRSDGRIVNRRNIGGYRIFADPLPVDEGRVAVQTQGDNLAVLEVAPLE